MTAQSFAPRGMRFVVQVCNDRMSEKAFIAWVKRVFGYAEVVTVRGHVSFDNHYENGWMAFTPGTVRRQGYRHRKDLAKREAHGDWRDDKGVREVRG